MRLDKETPSDQIEDRRGQRGGFGFPGGGGMRRVNVPMGGRSGGIGLSTIVMLVIAYFALRFLFGVDLLDLVRGGGTPPSSQQTEYQIPTPGGSTDVTNTGETGGGTNSTDVRSDAGKDFVAEFLGQPSEFGQLSSRTLGSNTKNRISSCLMALCSPLAAWRSPQWVHFTVLWIKRFTSTCPSTRI